MQEMKLLVPVDTELGEFQGTSFVNKKVKNLTEDFICSTEIEWLKESKKRIYDYLNQKTKKLQISCFACFRELTINHKADNNNYDDFVFMEFDKYEVSMNKIFNKMISGYDCIPVAFDFMFICQIRNCKHAINISNKELKLNAGKWYEEAMKDYQ